MATQLKASLLLQLEDKLSAGLGKLQKQLEQLRDIAKTLGLTELEDGLEKLRSGSGSADTLTEGLRGVERQADRTGAAIKRLVQAANDNVIRVNSQGGAFGTGSLGSLVVVPIGGGFGGAGVPAAPAQPLGEQLLLEGAGGGIPLNLRPRAPGLGRLVAAGHGIYGAAGQFGDAASQGVGNLIGAGAEAFAVYEPVNAYAERDAELRQIGVMEHLQGAALEAEIARLNTLVNADALATGNSSRSIVEAYRDLLGQGLPRAQVDSILRAHSDAATAYNISPEILGPVTGSVVGNLGIKSGPDMEAALAALAAATQQGRVKMEDLARELPGLTGVAASLGMTGRQTLNTLAAGLEISGKTASDGTQAGVNFTDLLAYITSNREDNLSRTKLGLDLPALLLKGEKEGKAAFDVYLEEIKKLVAGKSPVAQAQAISSLVTNKQARDALLALIQHNSEFEQLRQLLSGISEIKLQTDLASVLGSVAVSLREFNENLSQSNRVLGEGFAPTIRVASGALDGLNAGLTWLNTNAPGALHWVLGIVSGMLALGAVATTLKVAGPLFVAGWKLLVSILMGFGTVLDFVVTGLRFVVFLIASLAGLSAGVVAAIGAAVAAIGLAAYELYKHWDQVGPFFAKLWEDTKVIFNSFLTWVVDWASKIGGYIASGISTGFRNGVNGSINLLEHLAPSGSGLEKWLDHLKLPQLQPPGSGAASGGAAGAALGAQVGGTITVQAAPGTAVTGVQSSNPRVPLVAATAPSAGPVLSRH